MALELDHPIGFIGLGVMGTPMANHLHRAGAKLVVHNRTPEKTERFLKEFAGSRSANSLAEVVRDVSGGAVITMLTNTPAFETVMLGKGGIVEAIEPGTLVIDMSTTGLAKTREVAAILRERGCGYVDAPVSGGEVGAKEAVLSIMAGGEPEDFERAKPIFEVLGRQIAHLGPVGSGQICKLANQTIVGITVAAVAEALILAEKAGVDPSAVRDAIRGGFAESRILAEHGERMVTGNFEPGGKSAYQLKDVREAREVAREAGIELPMLFRNVELWEAMVEEWGGEAVDHSGIFRMYQETL
ncbi:MAG: NAD(P)-dependent oxidoreductase [Verrucomicrobiota bacterium]